MPDRNMPNVRIEKISLERIGDLYDAIVESSKEWFAEGMIDQPDVSMDELESWIKVLPELWEKDEFYMFNILDASTDQVVGLTFLNHVSRQYQMANLGYMVRTSRTGEGIATEAARLVARYGFEKLGLQRVEIIARPENPASLKVAEKMGAVREGLLRNRVQHHGSPCDVYMHSLIPADVGIKKSRDESS
jgi:RimJ/RimL family protein N-acetyltransferase